MRDSGGNLVLSATDLSNFLGCRHRTALEMAAAHGKRHKPKFHDPLLEILFQRGLDHEKAYVQTLASAGRQVVDLADVKDPRDAVARTLDAMRAGADVVVQAALGDERWYGRPDVMLRVDAPSDLGSWSYQVVDTKLARETRAGTILQLGLDSELLGTAQGRSPEHFHVVTPDPDMPRHSFRVDDYAAYFRLIRAGMLDVVAQDEDAIAAANYPEPADHCDVCPWSSECSKKRRLDDHLSLVAGISRLQRREFESRDVTTMTRLAELALPLQFTPKRGAIETYVRVQEQARVQFQSRGKTPPIHELREIEKEKGLLRLPEPSPGDIFLDLEGDALADGGGREYLFGLVTLDAAGASVYRSVWAFTDQEEREAFEVVMDLIGASLQQHAGAHVYHYAPYEPSAFKRLMGRYATREQELDRLLRSDRFVDLYGVVRQGLRAGIERYSIKNLEVLYGFNRTVPLADANRSLLVMAQALELQCPDTVPPEVRNEVEGYNKDDCVSTLRLRNWLEELRASVEAAGTPMPRPEPKAGDASENVDARAQRVETLRAQLLTGVPDVPTAVLFKRRTDAVALREAMTELEGRMSERLEKAADSLQPWLEEQGYSFVEVEGKYARVNVARASWMNKKRQQPWVWFALDALFPYGFRRVQEEHPLVWVLTSNLEKDDRRVFQEHLTNRLRGKGGDWINEDCGRDYPAGHYISTHGDRERLALAQSPEAIASFAREALAPILVLGNDVEAALQETLGK